MNGDLTPEMELLVRAAARVGAEEAARYAARGPEQGQERTLSGALPVYFREVALSSAQTVEIVGSPVRSLTIIRCDPADVTLRLWGHDGQRVSMRAWPGLTFHDLPIARAELIVNTAGPGSSLCCVMASPVPRAFDPVREAEWEPFVQRGTPGTGAVGPSITLVAGFDYELLGLSLLYQASADVANRLPHVNVYPANALVGDHPMGTAWIDTNVTASQQAILQVIFGGGAVRQADTGVVIIRPAAAATVEQFMAQAVPLWSGRVESTAPSPQIDVSTSNGHANDIVDLTLVAKRRRIR